MNELLRECRRELDKTVWRDREQFPGDPYCELCGAAQSWAMRRGHEADCIIAKLDAVLGAEKDVAPQLTAEASSRCPMCGIETPHRHTTQQVVNWLELQANRFLQSEDRHKVVILNSAYYELKEPQGWLVTGISDGQPVAIEMYLERSKRWSRHAYKVTPLYFALHAPAAPDATPSCKNPKGCDWPALCNETAGHCTYATADAETLKTLLEELRCPANRLEQERSEARLAQLLLAESRLARYESAKLPEEPDILTALRATAPASVWWDIVDYGDNLRTAYASQAVRLEEAEKSGKVVEVALRRNPLIAMFLDQGFWHAHHVDIVIRYNGEDRRYEADWIKDIWYSALAGGRKG